MNIRLSRIAIGREFRRIELRDQFSFMDLGSLIDRKANHAPSNLRADNHVIPRDHPRQGNLIAMRSGRYVHNQRHDKQHSDKSKKL